MTAKHVQTYFRSVCWLGQNHNHVLSSLSISCIFNFPWWNLKIYHENEASVINKYSRVQPDGNQWHATVYVRSSSSRGSSSSAAPPFNELTSPVGNFRASRIICKSSTVSYSRNSTRNKKKQNMILLTLINSVE